MYSKRKVAEDILPTIENIDDAVQQKLLEMLSDTGMKHDDDPNDTMFNAIPNVTPLNDQLDKIGINNKTVITEEFYIVSEHDNDSMMALFCLTMLLSLLAFLVWYSKMWRHRAFEHENLSDDSKDLWTMQKQTSLKATIADVLHLKKKYLSFINVRKVTRPARSKRSDSKWGNNTTHYSFLDTDSDEVVYQVT